MWEEGENSNYYSGFPVFNVCKLLLPSLSPELPEIIKEFENPAKNSKYLGDIRTYHCIWQSRHY